MQSSEKENYEYIILKIIKKTDAIFNRNDIFNISVMCISLVRLIL